MTVRASVLLPAAGPPPAPPGRWAARLLAARAGWPGGRVAAWLRGCVGEAPPQIPSIMVLGIC